MTKDQLRDTLYRGEPDEEGYLTRSVQEVITSGSNIREIRTEEYKRVPMGTETVRRRIFDETHEGEVVMRTESLSTAFPEPHYVYSIGSNEPIPIYNYNSNYSRDIFRNLAPMPPRPKKLKPKNKVHPLTTIFKD